MILRIEDIDATRSRPEFEDALLEDLAWLGIAWETPVRRQSEHLGDYLDALAALERRGLLYRCFKTRREVLDEIARAPHGPGEGPDGGAYHGGAGGVVAGGGVAGRGRPFAWRLSLERARTALGGLAGLGFREEGAGPGGEAGWIAADPGRAGDVILARKDVGVAYHLAVVVDDALQGVTHVIRGDDLFEASHVQRLLQALLALPTPTYRHHPMQLGEDGRRLAKRSGAPSLRSLRAEGVTPGQVRMRLGFGPA